MAESTSVFTLADDKSHSVDTGFEVDDALLELRREMAKINDNQHAWFTAICTVTLDGKFGFKFDYDHLPPFDIIPSPGKWIDEFKHYPRPDLQRQIQDWIDGKVEPEVIVERLQKLSVP